MYVQCHASLARILVASTNYRTLTICLLLLIQTQAKQLKDYENAVIAKRMEELDEDELQALVEEVERDDF
jgi:cytochrome c-type biogenesis protein CcmH/NrfG